MISYRPITVEDCEIVAGIHALSWSFAYRGILSDSYLDHEVGAERLIHWKRRLSEPLAADWGVLALQDGIPVGFAFAVRDEHKHWGSLLDNLHVLSQAQGLGIGRGLMRELIADLLRAESTSGLHLWAYDKNRAARRFYESLGARVVNSEVVDTPDGGRASAHVYAWQRLKELQELLIKVR